MSHVTQFSLRPLALCALATLSGCGGGGGSDDNNGVTEPLNPFSVDSYSEYREGDDLSGIWMMVINTEYNRETSQGIIRHATESVRSTVFIKENAGDSYSSIQVSNPICAPASMSQVYADYTGSNVDISTSYVDFSLTVNTHSRMSGVIESFNGYGCGLGDICLDGRSDVESRVEMVKVAPLPLGNWGSFVNASPTIGNIRGVVQTDATSDAFEFDNDIDCFMHAKGNGGFFFAAYLYPPAGPDYESIVVSTDDGDNLLFTQSGGILEYSNIRNDDYYYYSYFSFAQRTGNFGVNIEGTNPITINISADASSDASSDATSDGAELDIEIGF